MIADDRRIVGSAICDHMETRFCDRLRSSAIDRTRSQTIAENRTKFYSLRSSAIVAIIRKHNCDRLRSIAIEIYSIILIIDLIIQHFCDRLRSFAIIWKQFALRSLRSHGSVISAMHYDRLRSYGNRQILYPYYKNK